MTATTLTIGEVEGRQAMRLRSGVAIAALLAAMIGLLTLALVNLGTVINPGFKDFVFSVGKAWVPGATGIGPYAGKESFLLLGWLGSWVVLHFALRKKDANVRLWIGIFLAGILLATLLLWPPIFEAIASSF